MMLKTVLMEPTSQPPVMMRAFLPGSGKNGCTGFFLPKRAAGGSCLLWVWRILSLSLETQEQQTLLDLHFKITFTTSLL